METKDFMEMMAKKPCLEWQYKGKADEQLTAGKPSAWVTLRDGGTHIKVYSEIDCSPHGVGELLDILQASADCRDVLEMVYIYAKKHAVSLVYCEQS